MIRHRPSTGAVRSSRPLYREAAGPSARFAPPAALRRALAVCALLSAPAAAHDVWLEPSSFRPVVDTPVAVQILVGEHLRGETVPRNGTRIVRFVARSAAGDEELRGVEGSSPAGFFRPAAAGLFAVAYVSNHAFLELAAERFERYLREEGLERIAELRAAGGRTAEPGREAYSRCAKALVVALAADGETVDEGAPGDRPADRPLGCPLELIAEALPEPGAGAASTFRLSFRDAPLAGALVQALSAGRPERPLAARTDAAGRVSFMLDRPGVWLIKAVHMETAPAALEADWESWWASLTFELPDR